MKKSTKSTFLKMTNLQFWNSVFSVSETEICPSQAIVPIILKRSSMSTHT